MKSLILISILASSMAWAQCDERLEQNLTRGTLRLFERGVIGTGEIIEMVNSETPINPLRARTLGSRDSAAGHFFKTMLDGRIDRKQWQYIRAELRMKLAAVEVLTQASKHAREETAEVASLDLVNSVESAKIVEWSGIYYLAEESGEFFLRSALMRESIWKGKIPSDTAKFFSEVSGKPVFNVLAEVAPTFREKLAHGFQVKLSRQKIDLETGSAIDSVLWFQGKKPQYSSEFDKLVFKADRVSTAKVMLGEVSKSKYNYFVQIFENGEEREEPWSRMHYDQMSGQNSVRGFRLLKNGKLAVTAYGLDLENSKTESGKIQFAMTGTTPVQLEPIGHKIYKQIIFESTEGRVFVAASSLQNDVLHLEVFEPLKSNKPIFDFSGEDVSQVFGYEIFEPSYLSEMLKYDFFERKGVIYLAVGQSDLGAVHLFAPLHSGVPIMQMTVEPYDHFHVAVGPDREPYVITQRLRPRSTTQTQTGKVDTYRIFHEPIR